VGKGNGSFVSLFALGVLIVLVIRGFFGLWSDWEGYTYRVNFDAELAAKQQKIATRLAHEQARDRDSFDDESQYEAWKRYCALQLKADEAYAQADPTTYGIDGPPGPAEEYLRAQLAPQGEDTTKDSDREKSSQEAKLAKKAAGELEAQLILDQIAEEVKAGKP
jgi:hypothetical protein